MIVNLEIDKLLVRLKEKEISLELEDSARDFLIKEGYDPNFGARPMRRAVERHLEDPLAEASGKDPSRPEPGRVLGITHRRAPIPRRDAECSRRRSRGWLATLADLRE